MDEFKQKRDRVMITKKDGDINKATAIVNAKGVKVTQQNISYLLNHGTGRKAKNLEVIFEAFEQVFNERKSKAEG